jgi:hypothetical protein
MRTTKEYLTDLSFRYECPETESLWRVSCQIEMREDDENPNQFSLSVTLCEVTDPNGNTVDIYHANNYPFRLILESEAVAEFWSRAEKISQKSQSYCNAL